MLSLDKLTKHIACPPAFESIWAVSTEKKGYSGEISFCCLQKVVCKMWFFSAMQSTHAGTTTFANTAWSPVQAEADCLGNGTDDIDREGRYTITSPAT